MASATRSPNPAITLASFVGLLLLIAPARAQNISFGARVGVPITDLTKTVQSPNFGFNSATKRYVIGPTFEIRLPFGLGFHVDALYRRVAVDGSGQVTTPAGAVNTIPITGSFGFWQFPVMAKYRMGAGSFRPYVNGGPVFGRLTGVAGAGECAITFGRFCGVETIEKSRAGLAVGGGLDLDLPVVRLMPEIRYTYYGGGFLRSVPPGPLSTRQNQVEFLLGVLF